METLLTSDGEEPVRRGGTPEEEGATASVENLRNVHVSVPRELL